MASYGRVTICYPLKMKRIIFFPLLMMVLAPPGWGQISSAHKENMAEFVYGRSLAKQCARGDYGSKEHENCIIRHLWQCDGLLSGTCATHVPLSRQHGAYFEEFEEDYSKDGRQSPNDNLDLNIFKFFSGSYNNFCLYYDVKCNDIDHSYVSYGKTTLGKIIPMKSHR